MDRLPLLLTVLALATSALPASASPPHGWHRPGEWVRASVNDAGAQATADAYDPDISADGSRVVFYSQASNLAPQGNSEHGGVFLRDVAAGTTQLLSVNRDGAAPNQSSFQADISGDGGTAAFLSYATDLVPADDSDGRWAQVFVRDLTTGTTTRITNSPTGGASNGGSLGPSLSHDGRFVTFFSHATDLVPGDTNGAADAFVYDRQTATMRRISVRPDGTQGNASSTFSAISGDGSTAAFMTRATNLVPGDDNAVADIVAVDLATGALDLVSVALDGGVGDDASFSPLISLSHDGSAVAFQSRASDLVPVDRNGLTDTLLGYDVFVRDRTAGRTERISVTRSGQEFPKSNGGLLSADGRYVTFSSILEGEDPSSFTAKFGAYLHDRVTGATELLTVRADGTPANADAGVPAISADGSVLAFSTDATDLALGDENLLYDILLRRRGADRDVLNVTRSGDRLAGTAVFSGVVATAASSSNVHGSVAVRPEDGDLLVRIGGGPALPPQLASATVAGAPGIVHVLAFTLNGASWQLRVSRAAPTLVDTPSPVTDAALYLCTTTCSRTVNIDATWGTVGDEARAAVPFAPLGLEPGEQLRDVVARIGVGDTATGIIAGASSVALQDVTVPDVHVQVRRPGETGRTNGAQSQGRFGLELPGNGPLWMRACVGTVCGPERYLTPGPAKG